MTPDGSAPARHQDDPGKRRRLLGALIGLAAGTALAACASTAAVNAAKTSASQNAAPAATSALSSAMPSPTHRAVGTRTTHPAAAPRTSTSIHHVEPAPSPPNHAPNPPPGRPLTGQVIVLDPGHDGGNASHPTQINQLVFIVNGWKACDTTGTATNSGYPEWAFTFDVALRSAAILRAEGATVILTRNSNSGWGPCINQRAAIGNAAHADAALSIHADGGPSSGVGFQVILPGNVGPNAGIIRPSDTLGSWLHAQFHAITGEPFANYIGGGTGYTTRTDLGGLNLSTVPKVFIECANMRNASDATRVVSSSWRQLAAAGIASGITHFLLGH